MGYKLLGLTVLGNACESLRIILSGTKLNNLLS